MASASSVEAVHHEISNFGHLGNVILSSNSTLAVCFPEIWPYEEDKLLLLFTDLMQDFLDDHSAFLTLVDQAGMSEIQLMALLHRFGYEKAVIQGRRYLHAAFLEITFAQAGGSPESVQVPTKQQKSWPTSPL